MKTDRNQNNNENYELIEEPVTANDDAIEAANAKQKGGKRNVYRNVGIGAAGAAMVGAGVAVGLYAGNHEEDAELPTPTDDDVVATEQGVAEALVDAEEAPVEDDRASNSTGPKTVPTRHTENGNADVADNTGNQTEGNQDAGQSELNLHDMEFSSPQHFVGNIAVYQNETQGYMIIDTNDDGFGNILIKGNQDLSQIDDISDISGEQYEIGRAGHDMADADNDHSGSDNHDHRNLPYDDDYDSSDDDVADIF